jgi:formylglycine-generating enzyme required for sulfatase activity
LFKNSQQPPAAVVQLPTITNAYGMEFVQIPSGAFRMGSAVDDAGRSDWEEPHTVRMTYAYFIARTEVTRRQYLKVMGALPAGVSAEDLDLPVDQVSFDDATDFCKKLSLLDNREYRLPTEAEWEYACRAGSLGTFAGSGELDTMGWYKRNSSGKLHIVGLMQPNRWGLYDMHGNVAEWVLDSFIPYLGLDDVSDPFHQVNDGTQAVRGGSAFDVTSACRSASRASDLTSDSRAGLGFRVVIGPPPHRS